MAIQIHLDDALIRPNKFGRPLFIGHTISDCMMKNPSKCIWTLMKYICITHGDIATITQKKQMYETPLSYREGK